MSSHLTSANRVTQDRGSHLVTSVWRCQQVDEVSVVFVTGGALGNTTWLVPRSAHGRVPGGAR